MDPTLRCYSAVGFDVQCSRLLKTTMEVVAEGGNTRLPCVVAAGGLRHGAGFPVRQADAGGGLRRLRQPMEEHHHERQ